MTQGARRGVWSFAIVSISLVVFAVLDEVADVRALRQTAKKQQDARPLIVNNLSLALLESHDLRARTSTAGCGKCP
jgi:hypothetical protein